MALDSAIGSFTVPAGGGTIAVNMTPAFLPKVVLLFGNNKTADGFGVNGALNFGAAIATTNVTNMSFYNLDNQNPTANSRMKSIAFLYRNHASNAPGVLEQCTLASLDSDGFTLTKTVGNGTGEICKYLALGGADISNVFLGEFQGPIAGGTGNKAFTGVGFQGNLLLLFGAQWIGAGNQTGSDANLCLGIAKSSTERAVIAAGMDHGTASASRAESYQSASKCLALLDAHNATTDNLADFVSFDADGFTLNYSKVTNQVRFFGLVLQGTFQSHIASFARETATGNKDYTTGFTPGVVLLGGTYATAMDTETTQAHFSLGLGDGTNSHGTWAGDAASIASDANQYVTGSHIYSQATNPSTLATQAALTSMLATGYRLNYGTADGTARQVMQLALASEDIGPDTGTDSGAVQASEEVQPITVGVGAVEAG